MNNWMELLSDVSEALRSNRQVRLFLVIGLVALCGWGAASGLSGIAGAPRREEGEVAATTRGSATDAQLSAIEGYGESESALVAKLGSCEWASAAGGGALRFSGDEFSSGGAAAEGFAVTSVRESSPVVSTATDNEAVTSTTTETTFSVLMGDGTTSIETLTEVATDGSVTRTLSGDAFGGTWTAASASDDLAVEHDDHLSELVDGSDDALRDALWNWSQANAPSASVARWLGTARIDDNAGTVALDISLNDVSTTRVTATYSTSHGDFTIARAD